MEKQPGILRALEIAEQRWPEARNAKIALAFHCGVSVQSVYDWERIGGIPTTRHAQRVCEVTGVPVADLVPPAVQPNTPEGPKPRTRDNGAAAVRRSRRTAAPAESEATPLRACVGFY